MLKKNLILVDLDKELISNEEGQLKLLSSFFSAAAAALYFLLNAQLNTQHDLMKANVK